jgi:hypothetical protein
MTLALRAGEERSMRRARSARIVPFVLVLLLFAPAAAQGARRRSQFVVIPFPRGGEAAVGLTNGPLLIRSVTLENRPAVEDVRGARRDRRDTTLMRWVFHVANAGRHDWHARIQVTVLDSRGRRLAYNKRHGEIDARDFHDRITVFTRIRTLAYPRADRVRIRADSYSD